MPTEVTANQWSYYTILVRKVYAADPLKQTAELLEGMRFTPEGISAAIDQLKGQPSQPIMPAYIPPLGSYLVEGVVVDVKQSKHKTSTYVYSDGFYVGTIGHYKANVLITTHLGSAGQAHAAVIAYAAATGKCGVCHKKLTVKASIDAGIGPKCAKNYGL